MYKNMIASITSKTSSLILVFAILFVLFAQHSFAQTIPLTSEHWEAIDNANGQSLDLQVTTYKGKRAIHLGRHEIARLTTNTYSNFVLEMEIAGKAMPGIAFRANELWDYEFLYFRVFSGGETGATQYVPIHNGALPWQLYNDPIHERVAEFEPEEWFNVRLEVFENRMRVFVGEVDSPNMELELLYDELKSGNIFLKTSFAEMYFANVEIRELTESFEVPEYETPHEYLSTWRISEQTMGNIVSQRQFGEMISNAKENHTWKTIEADKFGVVNLAEYFDHPKESAFAIANIESRSEKTSTLAFDYTNLLLIALNGQIIFNGRELDSDNFMRMYDGEQEIPLSLQEGENELVFWIRSDDEWQEGVGNPAYLGRKQAMNWGFIARLIE